MPPNLEKPFTQMKCTRVPESLGGLLMPIPLTSGLPLTPSNLITTTPSSFTETLESTNCKGLLAPTIAKISKSDRTCQKSKKTISKCQSQVLPISPKHKE